MAGRKSSEYIFLKNFWRTVSAVIILDLEQK